MGMCKAYIAAPVPIGFRILVAASKQILPACRPGMLSRSALL